MKAANLWAVFSMLVIAACGSSKSSNHQPVSPAGVVLCPNTLPTAGTACSNAGIGDIDCRYGNQCPPCGTGASCDGNVWTLDTLVCQDTNALSPCGSADPNQVNLASCFTESALCSASDSVCQCLIIIPYDTLLWGCTFPGTDPNCPRWYPNLYSSCPQNGQVCSYSGCNTAVVCTDNTWQGYDTGEVCGV